MLDGALFVEISATKCSGRCLDRVVAQGVRMSDTLVFAHFRACVGVK